MNINIGGQAVTIDPDRLGPAARDLAQAVADTPSRDTVDIWFESDRPIREILPDWQAWYSAEDGDRRDKRAWRGWSTQPLGAADPHDRLEREAAKIPTGWHVYGAHPDRPLTGTGEPGELTTADVVEYLRRHGRRITAATWRSYVGRQQAPQPAKKTGRTPIWRLADIEAWLAAPARRKWRPTTRG